MKKVNDILNSKTIGISISDSEDISRLGYSKIHLQDAKVEIARHLLSCGCTLLYGGDLRNDGFTRILFDLVDAYTEFDKRDNVRLKSYLGWPIDSELSEREEASLSNRIKITKPGLPSDVRKGLKPKNFLNPNTSEEYYIWARSMTYMREKMNEDSDARIVLGGMMSSFKGKYPGIIEEVYLSTKRKIPVFVIGTFGGAAWEITEALCESKKHKLTNKDQFKSKSITGNLEYFNSMKPSNEPEINYDSIATYFNSIGIEGLNNGLSIEENKVLFKTSHIPLMVSLIIKGLVNKLR